MNYNLIEGVSKKTGNPYYAVDVQLTETYYKRVFLTSAEYELVKLNKEKEEM